MRSSGSRSCGPHGAPCPPASAAGSRRHTTRGALVAVLAAWLAVMGLHARLSCSQQTKHHSSGSRRRYGARCTDFPDRFSCRPPPDDFLSGLAVEGILLIAIHAGIDARLPTPVNERRGECAHDLRVSVRSTVVVAVDDTIATYRNNPAYRSLVHYDPLSRTQRTYHTKFDLQIRERFRARQTDPKAWFAAHQSDLSRIHELDQFAAPISKCSSKPRKRSPASASGGTVRRGA